MNKSIVRLINDWNSLETTESGDRFRWTSGYNYLYLGSKYSIKDITYTTVPQFEYTLKWKRVNENIIQITSPSFVPAEIDNLENPDTRTLGVMVSSITLQNGAEEIIVPMEDIYHDRTLKYSPGKHRENPLDEYSVCVVTTHDKPYSEIARLTLPNITSYCQKYGIDHYNVIKDFTGGHRTWVWNKLKILQNILPFYDWIICIDTDAIVVNDSIDIRTFIDDNFCIVVGERDCTGSWFKEFPTNLEMGVSFFKNDPLTFHILQKVYDEPDNQYHEWAEQYCLMKLLNSDPLLNNKVKRIDNKLINTVDDDFVGLEGTFIYHVAGGKIPLKTKIEKLKDVMSLKRS